MLISREVLHNDGPVMHWLPDMVHMDLYMLGPLPGNWIYGYINITLIVTKEEIRQITTNIKL